MAETGYIKIPKTVLYDTRLSYGARLLYGEIVALCAKEGFCWASNSYFARQYNAGPSSITRWINGLSQAGYVKIKYKNKGGNNKERKIYIQGIPPMDNQYSKNEGQGIPPVDNQYSKNEGQGIPPVEAGIPKMEDRILSINITSSSSEKPPQTTTVSNFINGCKTLGYTLDESTAREILETGIDLSWLDGLFNFLQYTAEIINDEFPNKPKAERRKLFLSALTWEDRREEFPAWREQQIKATAVKEVKQRKEAMRSSVPATCNHCGAALAPDSRECPSCGWAYEFNEEAGVYQFYEQVSISDAFQHLITNRPAVPAQSLGADDG
jgi:hypothetical protein